MSPVPVVKMQSHPSHENCQEAGCPQYHLLKVYTCQMCDNTMKQSSYSSHFMSKVWFRYAVGSAPSHTGNSVGVRT